MNLFKALHISVFRSSSHADRFTSEVFRLLMTPSPASSDLYDLIGQNRESFRFMNRNAILTETGYRFSYYPHQEAVLLFRYLSLIPQELHDHILSFNACRSTDPETVKMIVSYSPRCCIRRVIRKIISCLRKPGSFAQKKLWFSITESLAEEDALPVYYFIFSQSFRDHHIRMTAVSRFPSLGDSAKLRLTEKIAGLKETDEVLLAEAIRHCSNLQAPYLRRLILILLQTAPSDLTLLKSIELIHSLDRDYRDSTLLRKAADALKRTFLSQDPAVLSQAVRQIAVFDHMIRRDLIIRALQSMKNRIAAEALRYALSLEPDLRRQVITEALKTASVKNGTEIVFTKAVRMIHFLPVEERAALAIMSAEKLISELKYIYSNTYYCTAVSILGSLRDINIYKNYIPDALSHKMVHAASDTLILLLTDIRRSHQAAALSVLPDFLNESMSYCPQCRNPADYLFESTHEEIITESGRLIPLLPENIRNSVQGRYFAALIRKGIVREIRKYSVYFIYENIRIFPDAPSLLYLLSALQVFSMREVSGLIAEAAENNGIPRSAVRKAVKFIRSDKELILFLHDFLLEQKNILGRLKSEEIRRVYRIVRMRHRMQEKGFTQDCIQIIKDIAAGKLNILNESRDLAGFFAQPLIKSYDFHVYSAWKNASPADRKKIPAFIRSVPARIIRGEDSADLRRDIKNLLKIPDKNETEMIFSFLMQILPIQSAHLTRTDAYRIFVESLKNEKAVLRDIRNFCPHSANITFTEPSWKTVLKADSVPESKLISDFFVKIREEQSRSHGTDIIRVADSADTESLKVNMIRFLLNQTGDSLFALASLFSKADTQLLETAVQLHDFLSYTARSVFMKSVQSMRHRMNRFDYYRRLKNLGNLLQISGEIPDGYYLGRMKPSDAVKFIKSFGTEEVTESVLRICRMYTDKELLHTDLDYRKTLTWDKVIRLLKKPGKWQDRNLAELLEKHIHSANSEDNINKIKFLTDYKHDSMYNIIYAHLLHQLWGDLLDECVAIVNAFSRKDSVPGPDITYSAGKNAYLSVYGGLADICIAKDMKLFSKDNFTLLSIIQEDSFAGFCLLHAVREEGRRILVLAGCEPSAAFAATYSPEFIYSEVVRVLHKIRNLCGFDLVVQIDEENAFSNREVIRNYIKREIAAVKPSGYLKKPLYLGSYGVTVFRSQRYFIL